MFAQVITKLIVGQPQSSGGRTLIVSVRGKRALKEPLFIRGHVFPKVVRHFLRR